VLPRRVFEPDPALVSAGLLRGPRGDARTRSPFGEEDHTFAVHRSRLADALSLFAGALRTEGYMGEYTPVRRVRDWHLTLAHLSICQVLFFTQTQAQSAAKLVTDSLRCPRCTIEQVASLTDDSVPGPVGRFAFVTVTTNRGFLLTRFGLPSVFWADHTDRVVQQIGRAGGGPGEYRLPRYVLEMSFGYAVFDFGLRRITSLDKGFGFLNSVALPSLTIFGAPEALAGGSFVLNANVHTETSFGHPLHIVSRRGEVTRSFGGGSRAFRVSDELSLVRRIALSRDNTIWAAHPNEYRIEQWDTTGRLLNTYVRRVGWFPRSDPLSRTPTTQVRQIDIDRSGRVWLQIATRNPRGTVVEVLDPERLSAITSLRINGWGGDAAVGGFFIKRYQEKPDGNPLIEIWGFRMRSP
jgi:hypothetical protein